MKDLMKQCAAALAICLFASACSQKGVNGNASGNPQFRIAPKDLIGFAVVTTNGAPSNTNLAYFIHLQFTNAKAQEFRRFTREHINQQIGFAVGSKVVAGQFVNEEVTNGKADLGFASADEAHAVANLLAKTLYEVTGGGKVGSHTPPAIYADP